MHDRGTRFLVGLDVGSATVKAVVRNAATDEILWRDYQRHASRQPEKTLEFLRRIEEETGVNEHNSGIFMTGSGGGVLAEFIGAKFVQEVTAVALAVQKQHPEVYSVVELGGQDAKIIVFKDADESGRRTKIPSMNDKCAGGTGAVIDKISAKLKIPIEQLGEQRYNGIKLHKVAGKCGVFAETDINSLQKMGTPADELMASLFDAIVLQNLSVLTRGHTLRPHVLLLGGPNTFIRGMREAWQANIPIMWQERKVEIPEGAKPEDLIKVPENAQYFAALGAVEFGKGEDACIGCYRGTRKLVEYIEFGRQEEKAKAGRPGLVKSNAEAEAFQEKYRRKVFVPAAFERGQTVGAFVGLDAGSTSTKAVLVDENGSILCKAYQLSNGNPIQDTLEMFESLRGQVESQSARLEVLGVATTGYAKDILKDVLKADAGLVETVAHAESALKFYEDPHVVVDVGGQDIKLIVLKKGRVKDFKLNTQCSAGNGYFLQSTAAGFGLEVGQYADMAFAARRMPIFGYGCAVFLQSDIVNFQRQGWQAQEILAGLAAVLPKNVFLYVASIPNLAALGSRFILQGGTQNNLAVVKAEVDFIRGSFRAADQEPEIIVHEHCGEAGAIGAAEEALRLWRNGKRTTFIGLDAVREIEYRTTRNEDTRCNFCKNTCLRTFIDFKIKTHGPLPVRAAPPGAKHVKVPLGPDERRVIIATCEKGAAENLDDMKEIKAGVDQIKEANPNLVEIASREVFRSQNLPLVADPIPSRTWSKVSKRRAELMHRRKRLRIGMPRVLDAYVYAPLFNAYLESLGVLAENIIYSEYTSPELYRAGASRGAIDPCFPAKVAISHIYNLIQVKHRKKPLDVIFFPMVDALHTQLIQVTASNACPTVTATPETVKAAFTKENNVFAENRITYLDPLLNFADRKLLAFQLYQAWAPLLGLSEAENDRALEAGWRSLEKYENSIRKRAREVLDQLEREDRIGIVMLGRPYHHDPGLNHGIMEEFQKRGYPIFSQNTLPMDEDLLERLFGEEVRAGAIGHPLEISDVWKNSYSCGTNHELWAAKFTARHPNLVALQVSSFKCGHDAPIYGAIEGIIEESGTPFFCFKDLDENKPAGSIKIRIETIDYFLRRYREQMSDRWRVEREIEAQLARYERQMYQRTTQDRPSVHAPTN
jgi:activator of 2-hydroxyglutaryl-CoA dehydratase/predicted nucleotide-binding protein (sugar kinase/HSP70/actin superfamily)